MSRSHGTGPSQNGRHQSRHDPFEFQALRWQPPIQSGHATAGGEFWLLSFSSLQTAIFVFVAG